LLTLCQEQARFLLDQREEERREAELARREELEAERRREEYRDGQRLMTIAARGEAAALPELNISTASTASTLILENENFVMDEVSLLTFTFDRISRTLYYLKPCSPTHFSSGILT